MRQQSYYYLNNRKYLTLDTNLGSLMQEIANFFGHRARRKVTLVTPSGQDVFKSTYVEEATKILLRYNPAMQEKDVDQMMSVKSIDDIDSLDWIQNDKTKEWLIFLDNDDMTHMYAKYQRSILKYFGKEDMVESFLQRVFKRDILIGFDPDDVFKESVQRAIDSPDRYDDWKTKPTSKDCSYDILFFMTEYAKEETAFRYIKQKFNIHSDKNVEELAGVLVYKVGFISPLIGMLEYMEEHHGYDKTEFIGLVFHQPENHSMAALYALYDFWQLMKETPGFVQKLKDHEDWDYYDTYKEFEFTLPLVVDVYENGYNHANIVKIRDYWTEVEFLYRRRTRIPYLLNAVKPLV
jgi:transcriptional regulator